MTKQEAYTQLRQALAQVTDTQAQDITDFLRLGAGVLGLPRGATMAEPADLRPELRHAYIELVDAINLSTQDEANQEFTPVRAGDWETVLASLILLGEWETIHQTAEDLRGDPDVIRSREIIE